MSKAAQRRSRRLRTLRNFAIFAVLLVVVLFALSRREAGGDDEDEVDTATAIMNAGRS